MVDWLVQHALAAYVPDALRRALSGRHVDLGLQTPQEAEARQALAALEDQYEREKDAIGRQLRAATEEASMVRDGLLYGSGAELVSAVQSVLTAAGFEVTDLDAELGDTTSADLLAVRDGNRCLIEVKSVSRGASENLAAALRRHISTWPGIQPTQKPLTCSALIVNHQYRLPPRDRPAQVYTRREFIASLPFPVIPTTQLFDWWRASDWPSITNAVLASAPPGPVTQGPHAAPATAPPRRPFRLRRRST